jgi:hypothetical protein
VLNSRWRRLGIVVTICVTVTCVSSADENSSASLTARDWPKLLQLARHGNPKAQTRVAIAFRKGDVVKQDFAEAIKRKHPRSVHSAA